LQTFDKIIQGIIDALKENGIGECTAWCNYFGGLRTVKTYFHEAGVDGYDEKVLSDFVESIEVHLKNGELCRRYCSRLLKMAEVIREYCETGKLVWTVRPRGTKFKINAEYEKVIADFIATTNYTDNTIGDVWWALRKYLSFLTSKGIKSLSDISPEHIKAFIADSSGHISSGGLSNIRGYVRMFNGYLNKHSLLQNDYSRLLDVPIRREKKVLPCITDDEMEMLLKQIDHNTPMGKRDYAIILLGMINGLRAVDIINLKLVDIDWRKGELRVLQQKTQLVASYPLVHAIGTALQEYILKSRPKVSSDYVFLRMHEPFRKFRNALAIAYIFNEYQRKAGIQRERYDGKGFHSLRRAIGKRMVQNKIAIETVAQVLGHEDLTATNQYIALDSRNLRECALNLSSLEAGGNA